MVFALAGDSTMTSDLANLLDLLGLGCFPPVPLRFFRTLELSEADGAVSIRRTPGLVKQGGLGPSRSARREAPRQGHGCRGSRGRRGPWEWAGRNASRARRSRVIRHS